MLSDDRRAAREAGMIYHTHVFEFAAPNGQSRTVTRYFEPSARAALALQVELPKPPAALPRKNESRQSARTWSFVATGVGGALLARLAEITLARGCTRLEWAALDWNTPALDFYVKLGAARLDEWKVHRLDGEALARVDGGATSGSAGRRSRRRCTW